jgi:hypothetical protein
LAVELDFGRTPGAEVLSRLATDQFVTILQRRVIIVRPIVFEDGDHPIANAGLARAGLLSEKLGLEELCEAAETVLYRATRKTGGGRGGDKSE